MQPDFASMLKQTLTNLTRSQSAWQQFHANKARQAIIKREKDEHQARADRVWQSILRDPTHQIYLDQEKYLGGSLEYTRWLKSVGGEATTKQLAQAYEITSERAAGILKSMERKGLIEGERRAGKEIRWKLSSLSQRVMQLNLVQLARDELIRQMKETEK